MVFALRHSCSEVYTCDVCAFEVSPQIELCKLKCCQSWTVGGGQGLDELVPSSGPDYDLFLCVKNHG